MRNLISTLFLSFIFAFVPITVHAADDTFSISSASTFSIQEDTTTYVTQRITITNNTEYYYTPSYGMTIGYSDVSNISVLGPGGAIPFTVEDQEDGKKIDIKFQDRVVGLNRQNTFTVSFTSKEIAHKNGSILEIGVPGVRNISEFEKYTLSLHVPTSFGTPTIIKPKKIYQYDNNIITFEKEEIGEAGIFVVFGSEQYYSFDLDYHITNSNLFPIKTEIALPPSTNYQDVIINKIDPAPADVYQDKDGNWLAEFNLSSQQKRTIHVTGMVRLLHTPKPEILTAEDRKKYLVTQPYWELNSKEVREAAKNLNTAQDIYEYVVSTLSYNYDKVTGDNDRIGAKEALKNPSNAVCLEFTDLFVALARSKGIPARSIEGYAHTENDKLRPLSLIKDVLHAWPEYYDEKKRTWIMVDPTWGNTTGGSDYFEVFDFDHIAFVKKGLDSNYPVPAGGYKFTVDSKDVRIDFTDKSNFEKKSFVSLKTSLPSYALSVFPIKGHVLIQNTGNTALYNKSVTIESDIPLRQNEFVIDVLPPYGKVAVPLAFEHVPFLTNRTFPIKITFEGYTDTQNIQVGVFPHQNSLIIGGIGTIGLISLLIIAGITRRIYIQKRAK